MSQKKGSRDYSMVSNFYWNNGTGIIIFYFCMKNFKCQHAYLNFMYIYPLLFIILCFLKDISSYRYLFLIQWLICREYDIIVIFFLPGSVDTDKEDCLVDYKCFFIEVHVVKHFFLYSWQLLLIKKPPVDMNITHDWQPEHLVPNKHLSRPISMALA